MVIPFLLIALMIVDSICDCLKIIFRNNKNKNNVFFGVSEDVDVNDERSETYCL